jgi:hypothetical protein
MLQEIAKVRTRLVEQAEFELPCGFEAAPPRTVVAYELVHHAQHMNATFW